jgi:predicted MFS family arabinose efflux permease
MNRRYALATAAVMGGVLIAHSILAFTKLRWVTGLLEVIAAAVLYWQVLAFRRDVTAAPSAQPR